MIYEGMTIKLIKILHVENYPPHFISLSLCDYQFFHITFQINMIYIYIYIYIHTHIYIERERCIYVHFTCTHTICRIPMMFKLLILYVKIKKSNV